MSGGEEKDPGPGDEKRDLMVSDELSRALRSITEDPEIPETKKKKILGVIRAITISRSSSFSGPIPPPEILKGCNEVVKDGGERIVVMAEKQSGHRIDLENYAIKEELKQSRLGQVCGFVLGLVGLILATILALLGHEGIAGIFGTITIVGLVTVFVIGKKF